MYALSEKYQNNWVKFEKDWKTRTNEISVSFVFNPLTLQLENPIILNGNIKKAKEFIAWLESLDLSTDKFYWKDHPYATRTYFYVSSDSE